MLRQPQQTRTSPRSITRTRPRIWRRRWSRLRCEQERRCAHSARRLPLRGQVNIPLQSHENQVRGSLVCLHHPHSYPRCPRVWWRRDPTARSARDHRGCVRRQRPREASHLGSKDERPDSHGARCHQARRTTGVAGGGTRGCGNPVEQRATVRTLPCHPGASSVSHTYPPETSISSPRKPAA